MDTVNWLAVQGRYLWIAYCCAPFVITATHPRKKALALRLVMGLLLGLFFRTILYFNSSADGIRFLLCMGTIWVGIVLYFHVCADISWCDSAYYMVRAFFVGDFAASLFYQLDFYLSERMILPSRSLLVLGVILPGYNLYLAGVWGIEKHLCKDVSNLQIGKKDLAITLFIGGFLYFIANVSYVLPDSPFSSPILLDTYALRTLAEFGALAILLAYHLSIIDLQTQLQVQAMENAWKLQEDHYHTYEASVALVNQKYHDLKHQLHLLRKSVSMDDRMHYIDEMERELALYEAQNKTGNDVLDTILTAKSMECKQAGICLTCVADGKALSWMSPLDINALFGNILDNAIEYECKIPEKEKRLIHISVAQIKSYVQIRVRNICEETVTFKDGLPVTTKQDSRYHGFGVASIRNIVEKYQGSLIMKCTNGWFEVSILFPVSTQ